MKTNFQRVTWRCPCGHYPITKEPLRPEDLWCIVCEHCGRLARAADRLAAIRQWNGPGGRKRTPFDADAFLASIGPNPLAYGEVIDRICRFAGCQTRVAKTLFCSIKNRLERDNVSHRWRTSGTPQRCDKKAVYS